MPTRAIRSLQSTTVENLQYLEIDEQWDVEIHIGQGWPGQTQVDWLIFAAGFAMFAVPEQGNEGRCGAHLD